MSGYLAEGSECCRNSIYSNTPYGQEACYSQLPCYVHNKCLINMCLLSFKIYRAVQNPFLNQKAFPF